MKGVVITEEARKMYGDMCPYSTDKCDSFLELDYKIQRCIDLGFKKLDSISGINVHYHKLIFHIEGNKIVSIHKVSENYKVKEYKKEEHYHKAFKVVV